LEYAARKLPKDSQDGEYYIIYKFLEQRGALRKANRYLLSSAQQIERQTKGNINPPQTRRDD